LIYVIWAAKKYLTSEIPISPPMNLTSLDPHIMRPAPIRAPEINLEIYSSSPAPIIGDAALLTSFIPKTKAE